MHRPTLRLLAELVLYVVIGFALAWTLTGCSTANNYTLPPYEVQRHELTCDRTTHDLPPGLVCVCKQYGSSWDCDIERY